MALSPENIDDLVAMTFDAARRRAWVDVSLDNQFYTFTDSFMKGMSAPVSGGPRQTWIIQVGNQDTFKWTGLYDTDTTDVRNLSVKAQQEWAMATCNMTYDVREEEFQGSDREMIVNMILMRAHSMHNEWAKNMETALWTAPPNDTQSPRQMSGIPFWLQKNSSEGFNGGNPTGFSSGAGGVSSTTYPNWSNYTYTFSSVSRTDLIAKWNRACRFTMFKPPHAFPDLSKSESQKFMHYTTDAVFEELQRYQDARNDNVRDLSGTPGTIVHKGAMVDWVPELTHSTNGGYDSSNPIYSVNKNSFEFYFLKGWELKSTKPYTRDQQHNVRTLHRDTIQNTLCNNRRVNAVGYMV